jgi:CHAT domain-containing protein
MDSTEAAVDMLEMAVAEGAFVNPRQQLLFELRLTRFLVETGEPDRALPHGLHAYALKLKQNAAGTAPEFYLSRIYRDLGEAQEALEWFHRHVESRAAYRQSYEDPEWREATGGSLYWLPAAARILLEHPPDRPMAEREEGLLNVLQRFKARTLVERIVEPRTDTAQGRGASEPEPITLSEIQARLGPNELLCDFFVSKDVTFLFAINRDICRLVELPGATSDLPERTDMYCRLLADPEMDAYESQIGDIRRSLGDALLADIADLIEDAKRILVVPSGFLSSVPWGTLEIPGTSEPLIASREIYQLPSATMLKLFRGSESMPSNFAYKKLLAVASPGESGVRLAGAEEEVRYLVGRFEDADQAGLDGALVSRDVLRNYEVLHIAAHAEVNDESPWYSGILLGEAVGSSNPEESESPTTRGLDVDLLTLSAEDSLTMAQAIPPDPYLRAGEIANQDLSARLAVLAGCESALGRVTSGEGVLGLTAAFLSAGVPSVVATLWSVDDGVTADVMKRFYRGLEKGETVAAALRQAQLDTQAKEETAHPFYWAGFVVVGEGNTTIDLERKPSEPRKLFVAVLAVVVLLMFLVRISKLR